jgi:hypothetical protein
MNNYGKKVGPYPSPDKEIKSPKVFRVIKIDDWEKDFNKRIKLGIRIQNEKKKI